MEETEPETERKMEGWKKDGWKDGVSLSLSSYILSGGRMTNK